MKKETEINKKNRYFTNSNNRILAENTENSLGFDIWLDLSGERHYLMHHRHNAMVYVLLKDGVSLGELARWKPENAAIVKQYLGGVSICQIDKMTNSLANVLKNAETYLAKMQETGSTRQRTRSIAAGPLVKQKVRRSAAFSREFAT